jgi:hypothetical protein
MILCNLLFTRGGRYFVINTWKPITNRRRKTPIESSNFLFVENFLPVAIELFPYS